MTIIGFNFTKVDAEKKGNLTGKININSNVLITDAKEIDINIGPAKDTKGLLVKFKYLCAYQPDVGHINFEGDCVLMENADVVKKSVESWQKNKNIDKDLTRVVLSSVLGRSTVEAIMLSRDLGLPAPIPLPKLGDANPKPAAAASAVPKKK